MVQRKNNEVIGVIQKYGRSWWLNRYKRILLNLKGNEKTHKYDLVIQCIRNQSKSLKNINAIKNDWELENNELL